ncbi:hypothetical protein CFIICLFH_3821 [Methylobacterium goesingense]|nr:hypothetical protein CFIICLFH_3821 [Methylobacterium goesingense]
MPAPVVSWVFIAVRVPSGVPMALAMTPCPSVRSTSPKASVPLSVRAAPGVTCSVTAPASLATPITGASLVPVMVNATGLVADAPAPSVTVTLKTTLSVSPAARKSTVLSVTPKAQPIEPALEPVLSVSDVLKASSRRSDRPVGKVAPPDHVAVARVLLVTWTSAKSVSANVREPKATTGSEAPVSPLFSRSDALAPAAIDGASLVPVTVTNTFWLAVAPLSSVTRTVKVSV